jgi:hypothetical protein
LLPSVANFQTVIEGRDQSRGGSGAAVWAWRLFDVIPKACKELFDCEYLSCVGIQTFFYVTSPFARQEKVEL